MDATSKLLERFFQNRRDDLIPDFEVNEIVTLIDYFLEKKDMSCLEEAVDMGCKLYPGNIDLDVVLCKTLVCTESFEKALSRLEELDIHGNKKADMLRLECYGNLEKYDEAIAFIDGLIDSECDYLDEAIIYVACMLNDIHTAHEKANHFIRRGLTLFPDNTTLKSELCINLHICGFHKEAMDMCLQLTKEDPFSTELWFLQSELHCDYGDYENAVESINNAITCALDEKNSDLNYYLTLMKGRYLFKNGSYIQSIQTLTELLSYKELEKVTVFPLLAECYMYIDDFETAYKLLSTVSAKKEKEDEVAFYGNFLYCCIATGRRKEAINILCEALKNYPHGILEHLSTLNYLLRLKTDKDIGNEVLIGSGELARKFLANNAYYN